MTAPSSPRTEAAFAELLTRAVSEPGVMSAAYRQFHTYSLGNQLLAWAQCIERGIPLGSLATFQRWKELGRYVWTRRSESDPLAAQKVIHLEA